MKTKTIRAVLRQKIDEWLATVEDGALRKAMKRDIVVTGGAIASMLLAEKVNDYDVYFRTYETTLAVARYYLARFAPAKKNGIGCRMYLTDGWRTEIPNTRTDCPAKDDEKTRRIKVVIKSAGVASEEGADKDYEYFEMRPEGDAGQYVGEVLSDPGEIEDTYEQTQELAQEAADDGKPKYRPVFMSTNAITLSNRVQIVIRFWGEPDEIHTNYDFVHCTNYWLSHDGSLVLRPAALEALLTRELRYVGSKYPICSLIRIRKFIKRNWSINAGQILKAVMQISELNLKDIDVLEDQLTGVDAAYFAEVIAKLRDKDPEKLNAAYLIEIIDRMF